ncbi:MAG TPA: hypothetical protein VMX38_05315 [Verrucomicrobiae bacterium]|nr:hypothetical protein [Verrucomicrobiae bacterium]
MGRSQPIDIVYAKVKHEDPRAEESTVMDSPQHLLELEPLYAIRPLYLELVAVVGHFFSIQPAIHLISAASMFGIGLLVLFWTRKPLQAGLLMAFYPLTTIAREGGPDAISALFSLCALWLIDAFGQYWVALGVLFISLGLRTDNLLLLLVVLAWLVWEKRLALWVAGLLGALGLGIVLGINHWAGNYGWIVLFRYSFIGGKYPAHLPHTLTIREYLHGVAAGFPLILTQYAIWILIGLWAWIRKPHPLLLVAGAAVFAHFLLFPSPEVRYLLWAGILASILLIRSFDFEPATVHLQGQPG